MIRSQLRQIVRHGERVPLGVLPATRHFSVSRVAAEGEGQGQGQPSGMLKLRYLFFDTVGA